MQQNVEWLARASVKRAGGVVAVLTVLLLASVATAEPIAPDPSYGRYVIAVNDGGRIVVRPGGIGVESDGRLYLGAPVELTGTGWTASVSRISGQADPTLGFAIGAANLGVDLVSFNFSFAIPVALSGTIVGHSALSYGLSTTGTAEVTIAPTGGHLLTAAERDTTLGGLDDLNKGLDIGTGLSCTPPTSGVCNALSPLFVGTNLFTGNLAYDLMVVNLGFTLTRGAQVTMTGFVEQSSPGEPVPEPALLLLLGCAVCGGGLANRRRRREPRARIGA